MKQAKQSEVQSKSKLPMWLVVSGAVWLALTAILQSSGGGMQPALAQQNGPNPTPTVEATQTPVPTPSECPYVP